MTLSNDLISQLVKVRKVEKPKGETTIYGTTVEYEGRTYVKLDGSELLTPVSSMARFEPNERVAVLIKDHTATVTGNMSSPAARTGDVDALALVVADKVEADYLEANYAQIDFANINVADISEAFITNLFATKVVVDHLDATYAKISDLNVDGTIVTNNLDARYANITFANISDAAIANLFANKATIDHLNASFADINFANIGDAAIESFLSKSGMVDDLVVSEGRVTGTLVGVTIIGDIIEGGTIVADKLVVKGEDGLYYKLNTDGVTTEAEQTEYNSLNGSVIAAKSITAEKIAVDDLVAFNATIGGFSITDGSLYSGVKESIDNSTRGTYLDKDGQFAIGDEDNYLRYYKTVDDEGNETYKLEISAESILFGGLAKSSASDLKALTEHVKIGTYLDPETGDSKPSVELAEGDSDFKQVITNTKTMFMDGSKVGTEINTDGIETDNITIRGEQRYGNWVWAIRANGNYGLIWKEASS